MLNTNEFRAAEERSSSAVYDRGVVSTKWKNDFHQLYNSGKYDIEFYDFIQGQANDLRLNCDGVDENVYLNDVFRKLKKIL